MGGFVHRKPPLFATYAQPRAMHHLSDIRFALAENGRDLGVVVIEHLVQQKSRSLRGRQPLEHDEKGDRQIRRDRCLGIRFNERRLVTDQRLGQPRADVRFSFRTLGT